MALSGALASRSLSPLVIYASVMLPGDTVVQSCSKILQEEVTWGNRDHAMAVALGQGGTAQQRRDSRRGGPRGLTAPATLQKPDLGIKGCSHGLLQLLEFSEFTYSGSIKRSK